jgi:hypothetical protein
MDIFHTLAHAYSEIEFFATVCKLTVKTFPGIWGKIITVTDAEHGNGLEAQITQSLRDISPNGEPHFYSKMTHTFTIYGDNTLIWKITDGPTLMGLANIQAGLDQLSSVHNNTIVTAETAKPPLRIPLYRSLGYESQEAYEAAMQKRKDALKNNQAKK